MSSLTSHGWLREGVAAAKAGNKPVARQLLKQVCEAEPGNELAWLWLAGVAESPQDAVVYLQRVLAINPDNQQAHKGLQQARLQAGIAEAKGRNRRTARRLLTEVTLQDPSSELAWLWLAKVADSSPEAVACLEKVLALNPNNAHAREGLKVTRLQVGIAEAKAGHREAARACFEALVAEDPAYEQAWHWLASVAETPREAIACLERILQLNPGNEQARQTLLWYESQLHAASADWQCPLCGSRAREAQVVCGDCEAVLSLDDPAVFFGHEPSQPEQLEAAIARLHEERNGEATFATCYHLGLAYLNLARCEEAIRCFDDALGLMPEHEGLRSQLAALVRFHEEREEKARRERASRRRVLVIDDSPTVRKLVALTLEKEGYAVTAAADGEQGLACARREPPDLVLLDITMPGLDGYQVCRQLRAGAETAQIPVVMLSGKDGFFDKIRGKLAGSTAYITKPFNPNDLLQAAHRHCRTAAAANR